MLKLIIVVIIVVIAVLGFRYIYVPRIIHAASYKYNFDHITLPDSPNFYLLCPANQCELSHPHVAVSPVYNVSRIELEKNWEKMIAKQPRTYLLTVITAANQRSYVHYSFFWRFPDIINVKFIALDKTHTSLFIMSQSLMGHSDFGVNKKRVKAWLYALRSY